MLSNQLGAYDRPTAIHMSKPNLGKVLTALATVLAVLSVKEATTADETGAVMRFEQTPRFCPTAEEKKADPNLQNYIDEEKCSK